jgi:hypothetical protein
MRSRSVGERVLCSRLDVAPPSARLMADWQRECTLRLGLEPGDVEELPLARARARWPDYRRCVQAMSDWTHSLGLVELLDLGDVALMACRGARYHHDGLQYGAKAFCNVFLSEDRGLDLHFPATGQRIALLRGTAVLFDTGQAHAVIARQASGFDAADFPAERDTTQVFLSWELPIEDTRLARALGVHFDTDPLNARRLQTEQVWQQGAAARVCPHSGRWLQAEDLGPA